MKCRPVILIAVIMTAFLLTAGCTSTSRSHSTGSALLLNHSFTGESTTLHAREKITYNVTTDGAPVNVLVLDSMAFEQYRNTTNGAGASYTALFMRLNVSQVNLSYTVPGDGTYYIVIDNTGSIPGGADGNHDIRVNYSGSFNYA